MLRTILTAALLAIAAPAQAERIARIVDGDTVRAGGETVRLMGYDTPESGSRAQCPAEARLARRATERLRGLAVRGLDLRRHGRDRYGRTLAEAFTPDGRPVAQIMVAEGLAHPYNGRGPRGGWCDAPTR